jgi:hypothetical protein
LPNALLALQTAVRNDPTHRLAQENLGDLYLILAQQSWAAAQAAGKGDNTDLVRKLRLAREILPTTAPGRILKPRTAPTPTPGSALRRPQG